MSLQSNNVSFHIEQERLKSFLNWPLDKRVQPTSLARVGFYHSGPSDTVKCFKCGVQIADWQIGHLPFHEHKRYSPNCPLICGQATENVPFQLESETLNLSHIEETELAILRQNIPENRVEADINILADKVKDAYNKLKKKFVFVDARELVDNELAKSLDNLRTFGKPEMHIAAENIPRHKTSTHLLQTGVNNTKVCSFSF